MLDDDTAVLAVCKITVKECASLAFGVERHDIMSYLMVWYGYWPSFVNAS